MVAEIKGYILISLLGAVLAAFVMGLVITYTDPFATGTLALLLFYVSVFACTASLVMALGLFSRNKFALGPVEAMVTPAFRQACFIALLVVVSLFLQSERLLYWWVEISIILFFTFIEMFFNL